MTIFYDFQVFDIVLLLILLFFIIIGIKKGLIRELFDIISTILIFIICLKFYIPLGDIFHIYPYGDDILSMATGPFINNILVFIILFTLLNIIKAIIGLSLLKVFGKLVDHFSITKFINGLGGGIIGGIKGLLFLFIISTLLITPIHQNFISSSIINETQKFINEDIYQLMTNTSFDLKSVDDRETLEILMNFTIDAYDYGLISDAQMISLYKENMNNAIITYNPEITKERKEILKKVYESSSMNEVEIEEVLESLTVHEESVTV